MPAKLNFEIGEPIAPQSPLLYLKDVERIHQGRRVRVFDSRYDEIFENDLSLLRRFPETCCKERNSVVRGRSIRKWRAGEIWTIQGQPILFMKELESKRYDNGQIQRVGLFKNLNTGLEFICKVYSVKSGNTLGLKQSRGESLISSILDNLNIKYFSEYGFSDFVCYNNRKIPFDFYLPDYNICIEYDGEQHFKGWGRDKENLKIIEERDNKKDLYCKDNNIKLIRIPYTDYDKLNEAYLFNLISTE